jgi:hypothetical protein
MRSPSSGRPAAVLEATLEDMPVEYRDRFAELLGRPALGAEALSAELGEYVHAVQQLKALSANIDLLTAERVVAALEALLREHDRHGDEGRRLVQAAVEYFVREEDDEEITGVLGFDDDIQVINAVIRALGRPGLLLPLHRVELG